MIFGGTGWLLKCHERFSLLQQLSMREERKAERWTSFFQRDTGSNFVPDYFGSGAS